MHLASLESSRTGNQKIFYGLKVFFVLHYRCRDSDVRLILFYCLASIFVRLLELSFVIGLTVF